ncbi:hypothetical protein NDU88_001816 [Pleurodeles waltl]|uniref:Uncharacterized protein n=1 Tax=Pleurodeles waltl TaxID=8319 RepID=A0AAV7WJL5_PLEWA|nr:hypothetical protein NDU88_001816 [Pleurodeles waltl]
MLQQGIIQWGFCHEAWKKKKSRRTMKERPIITPGVCSRQENSKTITWKKVSTTWWKKLDIESGQEMPERRNKIEKQTDGEEEKKAKKEDEKETDGVEEKKARTEDEKQIDGEQEKNERNKDEKQTDGEEGKKMRSGQVV